MFGRKFSISRTAIAFALAAGLALGGTLPAFAEGEVVVTGQAFSMTAPTVGDFTGGILLDGTAKTATATVAFSVTDPRGTGDGWHIDATATQFAEYAASAYVPSGKTIPAGALKFAALTFTKADTTSNNVATQQNAVSAIESVGAVTSVKVASAAVGEGMGSYNASGTLQISVPASTYAKTYKSSVTLSLITAP
jgi:hypothetical protein